MSILATMRKKAKYTSAEKQRQFSAPATPQFEQSSAGYHRLPPAIAETLIAGGRRQFHRHSPALTGSTASPDNIIAASHQ